MAANACSSARQHEVVVAAVFAEGLLEAPEDARLLGMSPGRIGQRHRAGELDVGADIRPKVVGIGVAAALVAGEEILRTHDVEAAVGLAEVESASSACESGSRLSTPNWAANSKRASATVRPIGPSTEIGVQPSARPSILILAALDRGE